MAPILPSVNGHAPVYRHWIMQHSNKVAPKCDAPRIVGRTELCRKKTYARKKWRHFKLFGVLRARIIKVLTENLLKWPSLTMKNKREVHEIRHQTFFRIIHIRHRNESLIFVTHAKWEQILRSRRISLIFNFALKIQIFSPSFEISYLVLNNCHPVIGFI